MTIRKPLASRELLTLVTTMVDELSQWGCIAIPLATVQAQYIAIICMLRAVGHVLEKVDCADPADKQTLKPYWLRWKNEEIFANFIEPDRNSLLKEFRSRLDLRHSDDISSAIYATPGTASGATQVINFEPAKLKDNQGRAVLPLFRKAITFWERNLKEIEQAG